jgi:predicted GNAT family acetyltransferase
MTSDATELTVDIATAADAADLTAFAQQRPLEYNDFASIAALQPEVPKVWIARDSERIVAASIDDGLAMSVAGTDAGLETIAATIPDIDKKLVIAGRAEEVTSACRDIAEGRTLRAEHFMAVSRDEVVPPTEPIPIRVASEADLDLLTAARVAALEEEYGIPVPANGKLFKELVNSVTRAVKMGGVAIWEEDGKIAFTAQLISKTQIAAMFGDLFTDPSLRGKGRATKALALFCARLMTESENVTLRVSTENDPAIRLYERIGFTVASSFASSIRED